MARDKGENPYIWHPDMDGEMTSGETASLWTEREGWSIQKKTTENRRRACKMNRPGGGGPEILISGIPIWTVK
jgi:hypothetical protein